MLPVKEKSPASKKRGLVRYCLPRHKHRLQRIVQIFDPRIPNGLRHLDDRVNHQPKGFGWVASAWADHENHCRSSVMMSSKTLLSTRTPLTYLPRVRAMMASVIVGEAHTEAPPIAQYF
jgi:hypothetical protein